MARTANIENEEPRTTEIDMTEAEAEEALKEDMRANEMDYLNGILEAADDVDEETKEIKIIRSGKLKEKVLTTLDELCGYNTEEDKVNTAKNL